jgi:predicted enzyme related to lactoylglutathione lyase
MSIHHAIDYIEISVTDIDAAKRFYEKAFGWRFNDYGPGYAGIVGPGSDAEVGGLAKVDQIREGGGNGPLVVLYSTALEASEAAVAAAGGRIVKPIFTFPGGRRFGFCDPAGNELAVWSKG